MQEVGKIRHLPNNVNLWKAPVCRVWARRTRGPLKADLQQKPSACQPETCSRISAPFLCCGCADTQTTDISATVFTYSCPRHKGEMQSSGDAHQGRKWIVLEKGKLVWVGKKLFAANVLRDSRWRCPRENSGNDRFNPFPSWSVTADSLLAVAPPAYGYL